MAPNTHADTTYGIQNTIAEYAHALDDGRSDDLANLFCDDGVSDIAGVGRFEGRDQIKAGYAGLTPTSPQRHIVANTVVTETSETEAEASSDFLYLARGESGWAVLVTGHYADVLGKDEADQRWKFRSRTTTYVM